MRDKEDGITERDVIAYLGLKLDDEKKWRRIVELEKTEGSWVQQMIENICRKARDPFAGIDWLRVAADGLEQERRPEGSLAESELGDSPERSPTDSGTVAPSVQSRWGRRRLIAASAVTAVAASILAIIGVMSIDGGLKIRDGDHLVALRDGSLTGLESYPDEWVARAKAVLADGEVREPAALEEQRSRVRGDGVSYPGLISPLDVVVVSNGPVFKWKRYAGVEHYSVVIHDEGRDPLNSGPLQTTEWNCSYELERGRVYSWEIVAIKDGKKMYAPPSPPQPTFKVMGEKQLVEFGNAIADLQGSPLLRGIVYLEAGVLDAAEQEFADLAAKNPKSIILKSILDNVHRMQRQKR